MSTLSTLIDARYKAPSVTVRLNGNRIRDVLSVGVNSQLEGSITSASIKTLSNPNTTPEARVVIQQGYDGKEQLTFTGYIDTIERNESDNTFTLTCRDVLKKALDTFLVQEVKFGQDLAKGIYYYSTYTSNDGGTFTVHEYNSLSALNAAHPETTGNYTTQGVFAEAVVQWLLHMSGLAEGTEIQVDSTNFFIGDLNPAKFHMTSVYDAAMQIANLIGWRIYADVGGVARFKKKPRQPGGYSHWSYTDKNEPYNIQRLTKTSSNIDLRNYVEVRGASGIRTVRRAASPYIGNTPYRGVLISEELIDTQGIADFMADRVLGDLNRLKVTITLDVDGNPYIVPGSTLDIKANAATGKFLVETTQSNVAADAGYKLSITGSAYLGDTVQDEELTPVITAAFVPTFVSVLGDPRYVVDFDGATSYSDRGPITRYVWSWPDGSTSDSASSTATFVFNENNISGGNSQNVTLTVYDSGGNTASKTNAITASGLAALTRIKYRHIYGAMTTQAVGSVDGGQTWTSYSLPAISAAASNFAAGGVYIPSGHALFGTSDGKIYKTVDHCGSMTLVNSPGGQVVDIVIPELDNTKAAAVTDTGKVLYSDTGGDTWRQIGTFGFPLRQVKMGFTDFKYVEIVGSGVGKVYETYDTGANWHDTHNPKDVLWATDGASTNYFAHTAGVYNASTSNNLSGVTIAVPAATVEIDDDAGVMAVDATGQHYITTSGALIATQYNPNNLTRHMIRDGEMALVVYFATQSGIGKSVDRNVTMESLYDPIGSMPTGGWGKKVAYGPLGEVINPGQLVYRGSHNATNYWWIATTSGWIQGAPNNAGIASVTPGGIAVAKSSSVNVDFIECVGTTGIQQMITHSNWIALQGLPLSFSFNNRSDSRDQLCVTSLKNAIGDQDFYTESYTNFTSASGIGSTIITLADGGFVRHSNAQYTTSLRGEMLSSINYTFFSVAPVYSIIYNADGTMDVTTTTTDSVSPLWNAHYKPSRQYKGLIWNGSDVVLCTGLDSSGNIVTESTALDASTILNGTTAVEPLYAAQTYGSCVDQSRVYYATSSAVYYRDGYGQGNETQIFIPASGTITYINVIFNATNTEDHILVMNRRGSNSIPYYSVDSGDTFQAGPQINNNSGNGELYFIDL